MPARSTALTPVRRDGAGSPRLPPCLTVHGEGFCPLQSCETRLKFVVKGPWALNMVVIISMLNSETVESPDGQAVQYLGS